MGTALTFAMQLLSQLPSLISAGTSVIDLVTHGNDALKKMSDEGRDPTPEEWDALNAAIDAKRKILHS